MSPSPALRDSVRKTARVLTGALLVVSTLAPIPVLSSSSWVDAPRKIVFLRPAAPGTIREFVEELEAAGGHASIVIPPHAAIVYAGPEILAGPDLSPWIESAHRNRIDVASLSASDPSKARLARVWNRFLEMRADMLHPEDARDGAHDAYREQFPDAGPIPVALSEVPLLRDAPDHMPHGAQYYDTSTYLAGSSAVGVWLLEAAGSTYDWTPEEEDETLAGVAAGLDAWVAWGGTMTFLTFYLDLHTDVPVSGVPIENPLSWDHIWIGEVLTNEGWAGANAWEQCFAYNNDLRNTLETNWCFSIFIVDSDPDVNQGLFSTGGYAWAYFGGPWVYMSRYSTWAYNAPNYFTAVPAHELGHIYFATDEYDGIVQWSGYLNHQDNASTSVICILNQNSLVRACNPTKKQLAWRDDDENGVMEPLDTPPDIVLTEYLPDPTEDPTPTWTGAANVTTLTNQNPNAPYFPPHDITLNTIAAVECRVDGGAWSSATADDGSFDAYVEAFSWTSPHLPNGVHTVEARAQSSQGIWSDVFASDVLEVQAGDVAVDEFAASPPILTLRPVSPNPARTGSGSTIRFSLAAGGPIRLDVFTVDGTRVRKLVHGVRPAGSGIAHWNGRDEADRPVPSGVYFIRLEAESGTRTRKLVWQR
jgi:hypothetical protein